MWYHAYDIIIFFFSNMKNGWLGFSHVAYDLIIEIYKIYMCIYIYINRPSPPPDFGHTKENVERESARERKWEKEKEREKKW